MYLICSTAKKAISRSAKAWGAVKSSDGETKALWAVISHPSNGQAALVIPETPEGANLDLPQETYDALLTAAERAALVDTLPEDWAPSEA